MQALRPRRQHQLFLPQLTKHGAQTGCMFSVLKATEKHVESPQKKKRPMFDKYAAGVASFVESYIAVNGNYPKISKVVQHIGGSRSTVKRILNELNLEKHAAGSEEIFLKEQDDTKVTHSMQSPSECMASNIINNKHSASPCSDKFEQLDGEVESAQVEALVDGTDAELNNERIDISTQNIRGKGFVEPSDPALLTLLDQAMQSNNKTDANVRVAPLMEVLQQKSSGSSRRVHLSACGGIENDLSWEETLHLIMPTSVGGTEDTSGLKDEQPKVNKENLGHVSSSSEKCKENSPTTCSVKNTIKVTTSKTKSVLNHISAKQMQHALKREAKIFNDLKSVKLYRRLRTNNSYAILEFKDSESTMKALKLKAVTIVGEQLFLWKGCSETVNLTNGDCTQLAGLGEKSVFQEVMQRMADSLKKEDMSSKSLHPPTYPHVEDKKSDVCMQSQLSSKSLHPPTYPHVEDKKSDVCMQSQLSDVCMQAQLKSHPSFSRTIIIQECPSKIPLESIENFFSVFGKVRTSYGAFSIDINAAIKIVVEFENESDKEKAKRVQQFAVGGCSFVLKPASSVLVIRMKYEGSTIDHRQFLKACKRHGVVEKIFPRRYQSVDVIYGLNERHRIDELLMGLRKDTYFKENWSIYPVYDSYVKADSLPLWNKVKVKNLLATLNELSTYLNGMLTTKDELPISLQPLKSTSEARKVM